ncbi:MAG: ABC transporter permease [Chloroflexi bacterium]|nr:ABC transporter permease [Chloroflexota bacterium]
MLEQLRFYIRHSLNDLRVNGQRTFFALLCIAAGVAAIVSLQTLAVMIGSSLTGNLQENNRGDIQFRPSPAVLSSQATVQQGVDAGILMKNTASFMGQQIETYTIRGEGLQKIQAWADENFPGQVQITYRQPLAQMMELFLGTGKGAAITAPATGRQATQVSPIIIDASVYPFYGEVITTDGTPLNDALREPTNIVISEQVAQTLGVKTGDTVQISGADGTFTVRGVVATEMEVKDPSSGDVFGALFGFYYLDLRSLPLFGSVPPNADQVYIKLADPARVVEIDHALTQAFPFLTTQTTETLRQNYTDLSQNINQLMTIMGLLSLLIGSIGIINTMQVIVRRRTVEIAVLKTMGLQANQVTILFMIEAIIMGVIGSLAGIVLGWAAVFLIRGAAETLLATDLPFVFAPRAAVNGFVVGVLVTAIFGFLPTLTAGQVRPGVVLRPQDNIIPRAGRVRTLLALVVIVVVLTLVAQTILGSLNTAFAVVVGAFIAAGWLYLLLSFLVWLVGRFFPSLGIVDLKISLRQMLAGRGRAAITLLALVVGVFSLSLITLFADSIGNMLEFAMNQSAGGNVIVTAASPQQLGQIETILKAMPEVKGYKVNQAYNLQLASVEEPDPNNPGQYVTVSLDELKQRLDANMRSAIPNFGGAAEQVENVNWLEVLQNELGRIGARELGDLPTDASVVAGRQLSADDANQPVMVITDSSRVRAAGINVGDRLTFSFPAGRNPLGGQTTTGNDTITFEVMGAVQGSNINTGTNNSSYALASAFPPNRQPSNITIGVDIPDDQVPELRQQLARVPGAFALETAFINRLLTSLLGTFTAFPTMVAALGLIVGGIVIANSVALTTLERRREIAVMKSVGLQRERVLFMLLLENGVMGLIGGLIGVGIGLVMLTVLVATINVPGSALPVGTALLLMLLCVAVALLAAMTTAWGASGEKPLNVLRYE